MHLSLRRPAHRIAAVTAAVVVALGLFGVHSAIAAGDDGDNRPAGAAAPAKAAIAPGAAESVFTALDACPLHNAGFAKNKSKTINVSGRCSVPASATALVFAITAAQGKGTGTLSVYGDPGTKPGAAAVAYGKGRPGVGNGTVKLTTSGATRKLTIANHGPAVKVTLKTVGYFAPQMAAFVEQNGTLGASTRVVSSVRESVGRYLVTFDRPIDGCSFVVTPFAFNWVTAVGPAGANSARVFIHDQVSPFTDHDTSFFIQATC